MNQWDRPSRPLTGQITNHPDQAGLAPLLDESLVGQRARCAARSNEIVANAVYQLKGMDYAHETLFWSS